MKIILPIFLWCLANLKCTTLFLGSFSLQHCWGHHPSAVHMLACFPLIPDQNTLCWLILEDESQAGKHMTVGQCRLNSLHMVKLSSLINISICFLCLDDLQQIYCEYQTFLLLQTKHCTHSYWIFFTLIKDSWVQHIASFLLCNKATFTICWSN